jgi:hypothetical protein
MIIYKNPCNAAKARIPAFTAIYGFMKLMEIYNLWNYITYGIIKLMES